MKESPSDAQIVSHKLMLRAGLVRQTAAGIYAWLPIGFRVLEEDRADRPRGAGPGRRDRDADADPPVGRPVAPVGPLRRLRPGNAAHQGPARPRDALRPDQRGDDHRDLPRRREELPRPAAHALPYPVEVPRRGPPALRRDARPRIPDEGRLSASTSTRRARGKAITPSCSPISAPSSGWASGRCR